MGGWGGAFVLVNQSSRLQKVQEHLRKTFQHQPLVLINSHAPVCERDEGEGEGRENREERIH